MYKKLSSTTTLCSTYRFFASRIKYFKIIKRSITLGRECNCEGRREGGVRRAGEKRRNVITTGGRTDNEVYILITRGRAARWSPMRY